MCVCVCGGGGIMGATGTNVFLYEITIFHGYQWVPMGTKSQGVMGTTGFPFIWLLQLVCILCCHILSPVVKISAWTYMGLIFNRHYGDAPCKYSPLWESTYIDPMLIRVSPLCIYFNIFAYNFVIFYRPFFSPWLVYLHPLFFPYLHPFPECVKKKIISKVPLENNIFICVRIWGPS